MDSGVKEVWCVDAGCSGNPGPMEYQCVSMPTGKRIFHFGPIQGTNNIGEFLAIVHAMALMQRKGLALPIYSDSHTALTWVRTCKAKTSLQYSPETAKALELTARAETWLKKNTFRVPIMKWDTERWGEIPADFGRKAGKPAPQEKK